MAEIEIEAFRAGTPASKGITAAQAKEAADGFNPDLHRAPVVMGHPADDQSAPAFGEISGARADGDRLFVKIKNLAQEAIDGVKQSRILNRSIAFWHPSHPSNPNPGKLSLRHLGLLGGAAPAIPNLPALRFSADDDAVLADGEPGDAVIFGVADAAPELDVQAVAEKVAAILKPAAPEPNGKEFSVPTPEELAAKETELAKREADIAAKETQFAADEERRANEAKAAREKENLDFATGLVAAGKFPAGNKDDLVSILNALPTEALQFSGDKSEAPAAALRRILDTATPAITFGAVTPTGAPPAGGGADDEETKALAEANAKQANRWKA